MRTKLELQSPKSDFCDTPQWWQNWIQKLSDTGAQVVPFTVLEEDLSRFNGTIKEFNFHYKIKFPTQEDYNKFKYYYF